METIGTKQITSWDIFCLFVKRFINDTFQLFYKIYKEKLISNKCNTKKNLNKY